MSTLEALLSDEPKGLPYPGWKLYHATSAYESVLQHGLLTRAELAKRAGGEEQHFAGGGTAHAVSMTIDPRVAEAILIGLKVISRLVKGTMSLGELIIAGQKQAPTGTADVIKEYRLTPERVLLYDEDLRPFHTRMASVKWTAAEAWEYGAAVASAFEPHPDRHYGHEVDRIPEGAVHVTAFFGRYTSDLDDMPEDQGAIAISGWAPKLAVAAAGRYTDVQAMADNAAFVEMYKRMLAMSTFDAEEVYDPLFFLTSLDAMREIDEDELWVVEADCEARWLCISPLDADRLGVLPPGVRLGADFGRSCESRLDDLARGRDYVSKVYGGERGWGEPAPSDTVVYLGRAMAEVRVFDSSLLTNIRGFKNLDDVQYDIDPDYEDRDYEIIAYPWFRARGN